MGSAYRADIDGLRAVAVLSVIVYHLNARVLPGGFVGVDIFFVISGFLITKHIMEELRAGRFSVLDFYRRRVKRIAPAMFVVVAATVLAAQFILLPEAAESTAESGLWSVASLANIFFWRNLDTSYFAAPAQLIPLLHLWSLGVEEQFYFIWPLVLMACFAAKRFALMAGAAALLSFAAAQVMYPHSPAFVYYMLPTRAGELLAGAVVASMVLRGQARLAGLWTAAIGALLVGGSLAFLDERQTFPGMLAIPPVLGAALLILAGERGNALSRALSAKPLVWVGLVSYSAYLWHWPLMAFWRYGHGSIAWPAAVIIFVLTMTLAWLSYRYVEQPARASRANWLVVFTRQYAVPAAVIGFACIVMMKIDGYGLRWLSSEYKENLARIRSQHRPNYEWEYVCQRQRLTSADARDPRCIIGASASDTSIVLWGDSNASHYVGMLGAFAKAGGWEFRNIATGMCPPIDADPAPFVFPARIADCRASLEVARPVVDGADVVILSGSYVLYELFSADFWPQFFATVRRLAHSERQVILLGKIPEVRGFDALCPEKALSFPRLDCGNTRVTVADEYRAANSRLREFADSTPNVAYFDAVHHICPAGICSSLTPDGTPIYLDAVHITIPASWAIGERILREDGVPSVFALLALPRR